MNYYSLLLFILYFFYNFNEGEMTFVTSRIDGKEYLVRNTNNKVEVANILSEINSRILKLINILENDKNNEYKKFVNELKTRYKNTIIMENSIVIPDKRYTSFSINKGEKIVFCIQDPYTNMIYDINTLMYVTIHEISHIACPEKGHTPLFYKIFNYFIEIAHKYSLYRKINYRINPVHDCGILINDEY